MSVPAVQISDPKTNNLIFESIVLPTLAQRLPKRMAESVRAFETNVSFTLEELLPKESPGKDLTYDPESLRRQLQETSLSEDWSKRLRDYTMLDVSFQPKSCGWSFSF